MRLSEQAIKEFKDIYHRECGVELSDQEAQEEALRLLRLFRLLIRPPPSSRSSDAQESHRARFDTFA